MAYYGGYDMGFNPNQYYPTLNNNWNTPQLQVQQSCPLDNRFIWVSNKDMARNMPQAPDKTILYLNENESYQYFRKTDRDGKTIEFKTFKLTEEKEPEVEQNDAIAVPQNVVSKDEFNTFSKNVDSSLNELKEMILSMNQKPYNKNNQKGQVNKNG